MKSIPANKPLRPWWREPIAIGIGALVLLGCVGVMFQDRILPAHELNGGDKSGLPAAGGGGGFCDIPTAVKSTAYNPSTRKSE